MTSLSSLGVGTGAVARVEVGGQLQRIGFLLLPCGFQELNYRQVWWQAPSPG